MDIKVKDTELQLAIAYACFEDVRGIFDSDVYNANLEGDEYLYDSIRVQIELLNLFNGLDEEGFEEIKTLRVECGVEDLSGIEICKNLEELDISGNDITDISSLAELKNLKKLNISSTGVSDISALSALIQLEELKVAGNYELSDISPLTGLTNLRSLHIGTCDTNSLIANLKQFKSKATLKKLYVEILEDKNPSADLLCQTTSEFNNLTYLRWENEDYGTDANFSLNPVLSSCKNLRYISIGGKIDKDIDLPNIEYLATLIPGNIKINAPELKVLKLPFESFDEEFVEAINPDYFSRFPSLETVIGRYHFETKEPAPHRLSEVKNLKYLILADEEPEDKIEYYNSVKAVLPDDAKVLAYDEDRENVPVFL